MRWKVRHKVLLAAFGILVFLLGRTQAVHTGQPLESVFGVLLMVVGLACLFLGPFLWD